MADNITITPGSGATVAFDEVVDGVLGTVKVQLVKVVDGTLDSTNKMSIGASGAQYLQNRFILASATLTRPANTTAYTANDAVVTGASNFSMADVNDAPISLERIQTLTTDTGPGTAAAQFRAFLFNASPGSTPTDNAAFTCSRANFIGTMTGTFRSFTDGSGAILTPDDGMRIITTPSSGAKLIYILLQTLTAFTPSANSTVFTCIVEGFQGRA